MKRLLTALLLVVAALTVSPAAQADPGGGAVHVPCTEYMPGSEAGQITATPSGNLSHGCRYAGPASGGGAVTIWAGCILTPAGNVNCN